MDSRSLLLEGRKRLERALRPGIHGTAASVRDEDIRAAYRLLFGREADEGGFTHFRDRLVDGSLTYDGMVRQMLQSLEFIRDHPGLIVESAQTVAVPLDGYTLMVDPSDWSIGATIATERRYEPDVTARIRSLLEPGGVFFDVGANIGWYAMLAAHAVGATGRVLAIEPNPDNCALVRASAEANGFEITVVTGAASDTGGWLALQTDGTNGWMVSLEGSGATAEAIPCSCVVPAFTLDQLVETHGFDRVDVVKIDVEGFEARVLTGAPALLGTYRPTLVMEWFPHGLRSAGRVEPEVPLDLLRAHDYEILVIGSGDRPLSNEEIDQQRRATGRDLLELMARPVPRRSF